MVLDWTRYVANGGRSLGAGNVRLVLSVFPLLIFIVVMHFFMPQAVLDRYWREPHFRPFELMPFSGWSLFAPYWTIMFMWTFMFPRIGWRRGILEPHRLVPRWYRIVSIVLCVWVLVVLAGVFGILVGFFVYSRIHPEYFSNKPMGWDLALIFVTSIALIAGALIHQRRINKRNDKALRQRWREYREDGKQDGETKKREQTPRRKGAALK